MLRTWRRYYSLKGLTLDLHSDPATSAGTDREAGTGSEVSTQTQGHKEAQLWLGAWGLKESGEKGLIQAKYAGWHSWVPALGRGKSSSLLVPGH